MIKTDPTMLVYDATPGPWTIGSANDPGYMGDLPVGSLYVEQAATHEVVAEINSCGVPLPIHATNARLICAAPPLLKVAQKLLLWMEECMSACDFNQDDIDLYHELRQTIRAAGGFSSETHWWQGPCICSACAHAWCGVVEIPIESTYPQVPLECSECHQMTGGPA